MSEITQLDNPSEASKWCQSQRNKGSSVGYVATMGALHQGHLSLMEKAVKENDVTCCSIFVNPLQFNNPKDLEKYPDTYDNDLKLLQQAGCDMVFTGTLLTFFPEYPDPATIPKNCPSPAALGLEGDFRPGHLEGVWTIVDRLFRTVGQCQTYFGEKDFQQTLIIRDLAEALSQEDIHITVKVCETIRAENGLALSSRNQRLSDSEKQQALVIYQALMAAKSAWQAGVRQAAELEEVMRGKIQESDLQLEYAAIRNPNNWTQTSPLGQLTDARGLIAAYLGEVRLIDNMALNQ